MPDLILASSSVYRRQLLDRLGLRYRVISPDIDESLAPGEAPTEAALRLARVKAAAVAARYPESLVIGSDQIAVLNGECLGKPGDAFRAATQLAAMSGQTLVFHTAVCLLNAASAREQLESVPTTVVMRTLNAAEIERYLRHDRPFDCAGSAKIESLGIALTERVSTDDPTALIGLPLIVLCRMLRAEGVALP
jgi:septum formation protein